MKAHVLLNYAEKTDSSVMCEICGLNFRPASIDLGPF